MNSDIKHSLKLLVVTGGMWATAPVTGQPELSLEAWSVRQLPSGDRHFVGWCEENREGRVSSTILEFDPKTKRGRPKSGRVYGLVGQPGFDGDAEYVWQNWLRINSETAWTEVTAEVAQP
jgi:hypothetical protein